MDPLKRGRSVTSSLIPFPRVGRSVEPLEDEDSRVDRHSRSAASSRLLYGQKRTGKSSLIPFPRVGRSDPSWGARGTFFARKKLSMFLCLSNFKRPPPFLRKLKRVPFFFSKLQTVIYVYFLS